MEIDVATFWISKILKGNYHAIYDLFPAWAGELFFFPTVMDFDRSADVIVSVLCPLGVCLKYF